MRTRISAGVITCNEEQTIGPLLMRLAAENDDQFQISEIIVISAECRDSTDDIVRRFASRDRRIRLVTEPKRRGKSAAVNTFLAARGPSDLTLLSSGDVLPENGFLTSLVRAFADERVGMAGGRPVPVNDRCSLTGRMASLMWQLHHEIALQSPKLGETIIFRSSLVAAIAEESPVDEASIEASVLGQGFILRYVPEVMINNRGPDTLGEWFSQRRRIAYGHAWLKQRSGHHVATGSAKKIIPLLLRHVVRQPSDALATVALVLCELAAKCAAWKDARGGKKHYQIWDIAESTKMLR